MVALPPFRVGFGSTVKGRDPAHPKQDKTVCQAYGYSAQEAQAMAEAIAEALNYHAVGLANEDPEDRSMAHMGLSQW